MVTEPDSGNETAIPIAAQEPLPPAADAVAPENKPGFLRRNTLRLSGILNLIGDVGFLGRGLQDRDKYRITGGSLYTLGGANLTLFGGVKPEDAAQEITKGMADVLKENVGDLPKGSALSLTQAPDNLAQSLNRHAARNTLVPYTLGAGAMLASGVKNYRANRKQWGGLAYGISSVTVKLLSFLVPEKSKKELDNEQSKGGFINWIREKPLRIFGYGSAVTDTFLAVEAFQGYKAGHKSAWAVTTAITYILADTLMAISNKDPANASGRLSAGDQRKIESLAADSIVQQPKDTRAELIRQVAEFLAKQPQVQGSADDIAKSISMQVAQLSAGKPWVTRAMENPSPTLSR